MSDKKPETKEQDKKPETKTSGIFYVALGQVEHMTDKKELQIFKQGDVIKLPDADMKPLIKSGVVKEK